MPPLLEFQDVSKRFGAGPLVLDRLNLSIAEGECVAFIGPSGCGKSTLLRLVAGLSPLSTGQLTIAGEPSGRTSTEIGFVFQDATLLPWLTIQRNVEAPLRLRGVPAASRAANARQVLELVGLAEKAAAYPRQLSGGQKMRVSIARALALAPRLLLLDEPFGALDEMTRERLQEEWLAIRARQAWTALFVTHSVAEAVFLCQRVIILAANPGRVVRDLAIDLPYPRTAESRLSREYHDCVAAVTRELRAVETPSLPVSAV